MSHWDGSTLSETGYVDATADFVYATDAHQPNVMPVGATGAVLVP